MSNSGLYFKDKGHATTSRKTLGYELKKKKKKKGFPGGSGGKESTCNAGDVDSIPGSGRSSREGNSNPLQYCLENPMDRGAWWATVHGVAESDTTEAKKARGKLSSKVPRWIFPPEGLNRFILLWIEYLG